MNYVGKDLDALISQYEKTGCPDNADFIRRYSKRWGGVTGADADWFYFGNGRRVPSRPQSLEERWAAEACLPPPNAVIAL
jgi:hypothetical protein